MSARNYYAVILASCVAFFAVDALAQTPSTSTAPDATGATAPASSTTAPATNSAAATTQQQSAQAAAPAKKTAHHARKHNAMHATHRSQTRVSSEESQYRTALRQCVEGQASQRDRCLDDAIAQYGRS